MALYLLENGHGVALIDLDAIVPQPRTDATVQAVQRNESASGSVHEIGLFIVWQWNVLPVALYQGLLDQTGLDGTNLTSSVTIYVPNFEYVFTRYNATAVRPLQGRDIRRSQYFVHDVSMTFKNLVAL